MRDTARRLQSAKQQLLILPPFPLRCTVERLYPMGTRNRRSKKFRFLVWIVRLVSFKILAQLAKLATKPKKLGMNVGCVPQAAARPHSYLLLPRVSRRTNQCPFLPNPVIVGATDGEEENACGPRAQFNHNSQFHSFTRGGTLVQQVRP